MINSLFILLNIRLQFLFWIHWSFLRKAWFGMNSQSYSGIQEEKKIERETDKYFLSLFLILIHKTIWPPTGKLKEHKIKTNLNSLLCSRGIGIQRIVQIISLFLHFLWFLSLQYPCCVCLISYSKSWEHFFFFFVFDILLRRNVFLSQCNECDMKAQWIECFWFMLQIRE